MLKAAATALLAMSAMATAEAAVITQSWDYNFGNDHITLNAGPNGTANATGQSIERNHGFNLFDASLGTLQSVTFSFSAGGTRLMGFSHNGGGTGTMRADITQRFGFDLGDGLWEQSTAFQINQQFNTSQWAPGTYSGGSQNLDIVAALNTTYDLTFAVADFTGVGTIDLDVAFTHVLFSIQATGDGVIVTGLSGSCDPNCFNFGGSGGVFGNATLTYTYAPLVAIGEPASAALLGLGMIGAVALRRRQVPQKPY